MIYNTQLPKLILPEYGRNIQQMIDHCKTLESREERTTCARSIIKAMTTLFPSMDESEEGRRKLWDHLAIMSGFSLDIDWPFPPISAENVESKPLPISHQSHSIKLRHYGHSVEAAINKASTMEPGEERKELLRLIAFQMKKIVLSWTDDDNVEDIQIFRDIAELSHGAIQINPAEYSLPEFKVTRVSQQQHKKKKRKKR